MRFSYLLPLTVCLAGQALAAVTLNVTVGSTNFTATDLVNFSSNIDFVNSANCSGQCMNAMSTTMACQDDQCTCSNNTGTALLSCDQCLFKYIIDMNILPPNPLMGAQSALDAFVAGCLAPPLNTTIQPLKLSLANITAWDGPESLQLGTAASVVAVAAGVFLGGGSLYLLSNIE